MYLFGGINAVSTGTTADGTIQLRRYEDSISNRGVTQPVRDVVRTTGLNDGHKSIYGEYVCSYDWDCNAAQRIILCESRDNPLSDNGSDRGLFQINQIHASKWPDYWERWSDAYWNIDHAYLLYEEWGGWSPWYSSSYCSGVY